MLGFRWRHGGTTRYHGGMKNRVKAKIKNYPTPSRNGKCLLDSQSSPSPWIYSAGKRRNFTKSTVFGFVVKHSVSLSVDRKFRSTLNETLCFTANPNAVDFVNFLCFVPTNISKAHQMLSSNIQVFSLLLQSQMIDKHLP